MGEPGPLERAALAVAAQELDEGDVDLDLWRRAAAGARDDCHARERYVRLRVERLRRDLRAEARPILAADRADRERRAADLARRAEAYRSTPEGEREYQAALATAARGVWTFSALYYGAFVLLLLIAAWLAS